MRRMRMAASTSNARRRREFFADLVEAAACAPARRQLAALPHPLRSEPDERDTKTMWPAGEAMLHSLYDRPDALAVHARFDRLIDCASAMRPPPMTSTAPVRLSNHLD